MADGYHHGNLRRTLLQRAAECIASGSPGDVSLRSLARAAGVSHAAPAYHFGTRAGLLSALAAEGFELLAAQLRQAADSGKFLDVGVAYVRFATDFPAHFEVMFRPDLLDEADPGLLSAQQEAFSVLRSGIDDMAAEGRTADAAAAVVAGWSLVHGLAVLAASGALDSARLRHMLPDADLAEVTRRAAGMLFGSPGRRTR